MPVEQIAINVTRSDARPICRTHQELAEWRRIELSMIKANCHRTDKYGGGWELGSTASGKAQVMPDVPKPDDKGKLAKYKTPWGKNNFELLNPLNKPFNGKPYTKIIDHRGVAYITEGAFKAMRACQDGLLTLSVPGVDMFAYKDDDGDRYLMPSIQRLKDDGINTLVIAYDADARDKPGVVSASIRFAEMLLENGFEVKIATGAWEPEDGKGMDDAIEKNGVEWMRERLERALTLDEYKAKNQPAGKVKNKKGNRLTHSEACDKISDYYGARLAFNTMTGRVELDGSEINADTIRIRIDRDIKLHLSKSDAYDYLREVASKNSYHPVVRYLDTVYSCRQPVNIESAIARLASLWNEILGIKDSLSVSQLTKSLVAAVARAYTPGCEVKFITVLQGRQDIGKSSFIRHLAGEDFFGEAYRGGDDKDSAQLLQTAWIHEIGELDAIYKKTDAATLKDNISKRKDTFRTPYSIEPVTHLRSCFIFGTANPTAILNDVTGSVRFWCVHLSQKLTPEHFELLIASRDEIWALATGLFKSGYKWRLTEEEDRQRAEVNKRFAVTEMLDDVMESFAYPESFNGQGRPFISLREAASTAFPDDSYPLDMSKQRRLDDSMNRIGYEKSQKAGRDSTGKASKGYRLKESSTKEVVTTVTDGYDPVTGTVQGFEALVTTVTTFSKPVEISSLIIPSSEVSNGNCNSQKFCENVVTVVTTENVSAVTPTQQATQAVTEVVTSVQPDVTTVTTPQNYSDCITEDFKQGDWVEMVSDSRASEGILPGTELEVREVKGDFIHLATPGKMLCKHTVTAPTIIVRANQIKPVSV